MEFTKYHGLGNDFIFVDDFDSLHLSAAGHLAENLCDRNFGIGGDGLVLITKPGQYFTMRIFNSDGTEAEMCGNAIRCLAKHLLDLGLESGDEIVVGTVNSLKTIRKVGEEYAVDMGVPIWSPAEIPLRALGAKGLEIPVEVEGRSFKVSAVSMGNPHGVIIVSDLEQLELARYGPLLETHAMWPAKSNIEFVEVLNAAHIRVKVWERGVGPTLACGTGACASVVICKQLGLTDSQVKVSLPGGDLEIHWQEDNHVWMRGPATRVFSGSVSL